MEEDAFRLKELSNQTIHSVSAHQDTGNITMAVIVYALSKLVERKASLKIKNWDSLIKKIESEFSLAIKALRENKIDKYEEYMRMARKSLSPTSLSMKSYLQEILRKASINKGSKIYEHGISMEQTAHILGITQWELSEYTGQTRIPDAKYNVTINAEKRAKMAMEFFS